MKAATPICKIRKKDGKTSYKWPKLEEAVKFFYGEELDGAHSAIVDITATRRVFHTLIDLGAFNDQFERDYKAERLPEDFFERLKAGA